MLIKIIPIIFVLGISAPVKSVPINGSEYNQNIMRYSKAAEIHNYLDESHDPCENFYDFVCSNYLKIQSPNLKNPSMQPLLNIEKGMHRKYMELLNDPISPSSHVRNVKNFYKSCIHAPVTSESYKNQIKEILKEFGGMPILEGETWEEYKFDWLSTVGAIKYKYDINVILGVSVGSRLDDNSVNALIFNIQQLDLPSPEMYSNIFFRYMYEGNMRTNLKKFFGLGLDNATKLAMEMAEFEAELSDSVKKILIPEITDGSAIDDYKSKLMTIDEMHGEYYPKFDIKRLVNASLGYMPRSKILNIVGDEALHIANIIRRMPKRVVANYVLYYTVSHLVDMGLSAANQEKRCFTQTKKHFSSILDNTVYRDFQSYNTEQEVFEMFYYIKSAFSQLLMAPNKLSWMEEETRQYALTKLSGIRLEINSYKTRDFPNEYKELHLSENNYVFNLKALFAFKASYTRKLLVQSYQLIDDSQLSFSPAYVVNENLIKVPVGILQPFYLWYSFYPQALRFSTLGFIVAHELLHGFDSNGRFTDKSGNLEDWWDSNSASHFKDQEKCFAEQYENFFASKDMDDEYQTFLGLKFVVKQTFENQNENIADNGGVRLAYAAYSQWYENAQKSGVSMDLETLPRLNYTSKQLFFIGYGQLQCNANLEIVNLLRAGDTHANYKLRTMVPLANMQEFSRDFNCRSGTLMNPTKKCEIY